LVRQIARGELAGVVASGSHPSRPGEAGMSRLRSVEREGGHSPRAAAGWVARTNADDPAAFRRRRRIEWSPPSPTRHPPRRPAFVGVIPGIAILDSRTPLFRGEGRRSVDAPAPPPRLGPVGEREATEGPPPRVRGIRPARRPRMERSGVNGKGTFTPPSP